MSYLTAAEREAAETRLQEIAKALHAMRRVRAWDLHAERDRLLAQLAGPDS